MFSTAVVAALNRRAGVKVMELILPPSRRCSILLVSDKKSLYFGKTIIKMVLRVKLIRPQDVVAVTRGAEMEGWGQQSCGGRDSGRGLITPEGGGIDAI